MNFNFLVNLRNKPDKDKKLVFIFSVVFTMTFILVLWIILFKINMEEKDNSNGVSIDFFKHFILETKKNLLK